MTNPIVTKRMIIHHKGKPEERLVEHHFYWCSGCQDIHQVVIRPNVNDRGAGWEFTGTLEKPTYSPSVLSTWTGRDAEGNEKKHVCHTFIRDGVVEFLGDCTHKLAGQKVPLEPVPDWLLKEAEEDGD